jgi:hypothetical protein
MGKGKIWINGECLGWDFSLGGFYHGSEKIDPGERFDRENIAHEMHTGGPVVEHTAEGTVYHVSADYVREVVRILDEATRMVQNSQGVAAYNFHQAARPLPCPACGAFTPGLGVKCSTCGGGGLVASIIMNPEKRTVWGVKAMAGKCS